jgi:hypothetical protein
MEQLGAIVVTGIVAIAIVAGIYQLSSKAGGATLVKTGGSTITGVTSTLFKS